MGQAQTYVERVPVPALAGRVRTVWIQWTGPRPYVQCNLPTGGVELHCPVGAVPRLVGPLTAASVQVPPAYGCGGRAVLAGRGVASAWRACR